MSAIDPYNETVRDCFHNPKHAGDLRTDSPVQRVAEVAESEQGARLILAIGVEGETIAEMCFRARACPHLIAALECCCRDLERAPVSALREFDPNEIMRRLSVPREKIGKILLLEDALASLAAQIDAALREQS